MEPKLRVPVRSHAWSGDQSCACTVFASEMPQKVVPNSPEPAKRSQRFLFLLHAPISGPVFSDNERVMHSDSNVQPRRRRLCERFLIRRRIKPDRVYPFCSTAERSTWQAAFRFNEDSLRASNSRARGALVCGSWIVAPRHSVLQEA